MAVTTNRGVVATDDPLSNDLAVSMDTQVANQDKDVTQFSSLLMKLPVETSKSFKEEWMEDVYLPKNTALSATAASADTNLAVTSTEGNYGKVGDIGKFVQTGEAFRITATGASAWTVVRAIGTTAAATAASGTTNGGIVIVNGSNEQDGGLPTALITQKTANYNYHQIIRNAYTFTNTAQWTNWFSGNPLTYHRKKIAVEHKRELENGLFWGARSYSAGTSTPRATFGGIDEFVTTNITDAGGTFDKGELQDFLRAGMEYGDTTKKVLFASPIVAQVCSEFLQDNWVHARPEDNIFGIKVDFVISGVTGSRVPVFVKNDWKRYGEGAANHYGSRAYLIDMTNVALHKAPATQAGPRFAALYSNRQSPDVDYVSEEFLSDVTFIPKVERAHAILKNVTG